MGFLMDDSRSPIHNIAHLLPELAKRLPDKRAVLYPVGREHGRAVYTHYTFGQLDVRCDRLAWGLRGAGIKPGMRVLLMVKPSLDLFALVFALFKVGAVPVMIDPGMGWKGFMRCVGQVEPEGFIGIPAAHVLRQFFRNRFQSVKVHVTWGRRLGWGGWSLDELPMGQGAFPVEACLPEDPAAILFTSGSTGPAKGVVYSHRIFNAQVEILRREYGISEADIDLPCFPLFALFSVALGATVVIPDMNPSYPAKVDPRRIVEAIVDQGVTYSFGSPALWNRVTQYAEQQKLCFPTLRRVLIAGAPVPVYLHERLLGGMLQDGAKVYTPYGATECLPVANMTGNEVLAETAALTRAGRGICVGRPLPEVEARIIRITDEVVAEWTSDLVVPAGEVGEICVRGTVVTQGYFRLPEADAKSKIRDGATLWHRIGDVGYIDPQGRLWFCGRKSHRVETVGGTLFSVCAEAISNRHPSVFRSALVGVGSVRGRQEPVMLVELRLGVKESSALTAEVLALLAAEPMTQAIQRVMIHPGFPVDVRHNAKINRELLAVWASRRLGTVSVFG